MDIEQVKKIARDAISEHYPGMVMIEPEIEIMDTGISKSSFKKAGIPPEAGKSIWIATFRKEETTEEGFPIERITRVTMNEFGEVIKISESK